MRRTDSEGRQGGPWRAPPRAWARVRAQAEGHGGVGWGRCACAERIVAVCGSLRVMWAPGMYSMISYAQAWVGDKCPRFLPGGIEGRAWDGREVRPVRRRVTPGTSPQNRKTEHLSKSQPSAPSYILSSSCLYPCEVLDRIQSEGNGGGGGGGSHFSV